MLDQQEVDVLEVYKKLKRKGKLSANLKNPTIANLRNECAALFLKRPKDEIKDILQSFGGVGYQISTIQDVLSLDAERFKPLQKYIEGKVKKPNAHNVVLLAWLIEDNDLIPQTTNRDFKSWIFKNKAVKALLVVAVFSAGIFIYWYLNREKCMQWNGVRYEKAICEDGVLNGQQVVAIDEIRLNNFKRITQPDTLTYDDINRVWYAKIDSFPEFYTQPGMHPIHLERKLKPLSKYIVDKYILKKKMIDSL
ncbi:hypothetical protein [Pedobacter helvus]|uniref:Uncharacterized protein n=1 Tax=Pedobacter helvus TaxID=2563444 RepID=A0ABW9JHK7_9SPHI|nr:hypothetical protein [Pedobacter ureilyticus]